MMRDMVIPRTPIEELLDACLIALEDGEEMSVAAVETWTDEQVELAQRWADAAVLVRMDVARGMREAMPEFMRDAIVREERI